MNIHAAQLPPCFLEGERAILGGVLVDNTQFPRVKAILTTNDFYREPHRDIWQAITGLAGRNVEIDYVTLTAELKHMGKLEAVGGIEALTELFDAVPSAANVTHYAGVVKQKSVLRKILSTSTAIAARCYQDTASFEDIVSGIEQLALDAAAANLRPGAQADGELQRFSSVLRHTLDLVEARYTETASRFGIPSGYRKLDYYTGGFRSSELIIICGRPSMGKTSFAWSIIRHAAAKSIPVAFFSIEMDAPQIGERALARDGAMNLRRIRTADLDQAAFDKLVTVAGDLSDLPIFLDTSSAPSPAQIRFRIRSLAVREKVQVGFVVVDYLQLMSALQKHDQREREVASISRAMKALAKDLQCPVIVLSQLNRELEKRADKRPTLADLRESGAIEQDADVVIGLYRPGAYSDSEEARGRAEAIILKQRNGPVGTIDLRWTPETATFWDA